MVIKDIFFICLFMLIISCTSPVSNTLSVKHLHQHGSKPPVIEPKDAQPAFIDSIEKMMLRNGLVDVRTLDSSILFNMRYSTTDNFLHRDLYGVFDKCYLHVEAAEKLALAQSLLRSKFPHYRIVVFDAGRPLSVQQQMWDALRLPVAEKIKYLSNPKYGSLHNYGAAVDVSIADQDAQPLDMGTDFDYFGELAYPVKEESMLRQGKLTDAQISNRRLLREVMLHAGFTDIQTEWWHFNSCSRNEARKKYRLIK